VHGTLRRAQTIGFVLAGGLLVAAGAVLWTAPEWLIRSLARWYPDCLYHVPTQEPLVALTIDDGPDPASTPLILDELRRQNARATFFLITDRVRGQESVMRRLVAEGHELGNHFTQDRPSIGLSPGAFEADLLRAHRELAPWARLAWARPASGWYSQAMIRVMQRHGYRCAMGSVYPFDATIPSISWATRYILRNARPGAILILHDAGARGRRTARVLAEVLPELRRRGYRVVSLSELVAAASPAHSADRPEGSEEGGDLGFGITGGDLWDYRQIGYRPPGCMPRWQPFAREAVAWLRRSFGSQRTFFLGAGTEETDDEGTERSADRDQTRGGPGLSSHIP